MAQINVLDKTTIDQIAAGEVVERPASVVKELVENAIDAGADAVTVEIKDGGTEFIRVTDNGSGIEAAQVSRAFLSHATSKIHSVSDLERIGSLGFRGEALSSIASVSKVELITKTKAELTGIRYLMDGGEERAKEEVGAPEGTTFLVRNLFYNTPARKKFLKQPQTEASYVSDLMEHLALSHPEISFNFINNRQEKFHTSGNGDLREVIYRIYGRDIVSGLLEIHAGEGEARLDGYIGKPEINRANRNFETFFVNGRYIRNSLLSKGLEEGYRHLLMQHKFPFAVLHITIAPELLDVNVHPSKMEVRFHNPALLYDFLVREISTSLEQPELIPEMSLSSASIEKKRATPPEQPRNRIPEPFEEKRLEKSKVMEDNPYMAEKAEKEPKMQDFLQNRTPNRVLGQTPPSLLPGDESAHANIIKAANSIFVEKPVQMDFFEEKMLSPQSRKNHRILGQIFDTYWLVVLEDKLFFIDQHAAHEKVKYEKLVKQLDEEQTLPSQLLSPPIVVTLTGREEECFLEYEDYFTALGFAAEPFGTGEYALRGVPVELYGCGEKELFLSMLDELAEAPVKGAPRAVEEKLASMACKAAVKGNSSFSAAEMEALIDQLLSLDNPYHCPHGRPTIISMSRTELERKFKRIIT